MLLGNTARSRHPERDERAPRWDDSGSERDVPVPDENVRGTRSSIMQAHRHLRDARRRHAVRHGGSSVADRELVMAAGLDPPTVRLRASVRTRAHFTCPVSFVCHIT